MKKLKPFFMIVIYFLSIVIPVFAMESEYLFVKILHIPFSKTAFIGIQYSFLFLISMLCYGKEFLQSFSYFKERKFRKILFIVFLYILSILSLILILHLLNLDPQQTQNNKSILEYTKSIPFVWALILIAVLGPIVEEIVFRHIMIGELSKKLPVFLSTILSMTCFILLHSYRYPELIYYVPLTVMLTSSYLVSGKKISASFLFHLINNTISIISLYNQPL